ncbi:MAG: GNAT family N-acetyltransferase [Alphaproteobacteria bacterium]
MVIRPHNTNDLPALWVLHQNTNLSPFRQSEFEAWVHQNMTWVAVREGELAGFILIQDAPDHQGVLLLAVDPLYRRQGIARRLMQTFLPLKKQIFIEVEATNTPALSLYQSLGFDPIGQRRDYYGPSRHAVVLRLL